LNGPQKHRSVLIRTGCPGRGVVGTHVRGTEEHRWLPSPARATVNCRAVAGRAVTEGGLDESLARHCGNVTWPAWSGARVGGVDSLDRGYPRTLSVRQGLRNHLEAVAPWIRRRPAPASNEIQKADPSGIHSSRAPPSKLGSLPANAGRLPACGKHPQQAHIHIAAANTDEGYDELPPSQPQSPQPNYGYSPAFLGNRNV
jgi:hypothetical protein